MEPGELAPKGLVWSSDSLFAWKEAREADWRIKSLEWGLETVYRNYFCQGADCGCEDREFCLESGECQNGDLFSIAPSLSLSEIS